MKMSFRSFAKHSTAACAHDTPHLFRMERKVHSTFQCNNLEFLSRKLCLGLFVFLARVSESGVWQWARQLMSEQPIQVLDLDVQGASAFVAVHHQGSVDVDGLEDPVAGSDREAILVVEFDLSGTTLRSLSIQTTQIIMKNAAGAGISSILKRVISKVNTAHQS